MSDEPPKNENPGGEGDRPKKRRRRRRSKNKPRQDGATNDATTNPQADANAPKADASDSPSDNNNRKSNQNRPRTNPASGDRPPKAGSGYRGKNQKNSQGQAPRSGGPKRDDSRSRGKPAGKPDSRPAGAAANGKAPDRPGNAANAGSKPKAKKRRKPRTKQCVNCYTPCTTIHRVRVDYRKQWVFVCDICWPTRCVDNPHYEFGGTWVSGRIVKPESQLRDEWLAKQKQKSSNANKPRPERGHSSDKQTSKDAPRHEAAGDAVNSPSTPTKTNSPESGTTPAAEQTPHPAEPAVATDSASSTQSETPTTESGEHLGDTPAKEG